MGSNYQAFGIRSTESTMCTTYRGSAVQLIDTCIANDDELQRCVLAGRHGLRLDRLGNEVHGADPHRIVECKGADRYTVILFHDEDEYDRRFYLAGAASEARADRAFQTMLQGLTGCRA